MVSPKAAKRVAGRRKAVRGQQLWGLPDRSLHHLGDKQAFPLPTSVLRIELRTFTLSYILSPVLIFETGSCYDAEFPRLGLNLQSSCLRLPECWACGCAPPHLLAFELCPGNLHTGCRAWGAPQNIQHPGQGKYPRSRRRIREEQGQGLGG